MSPNYQFHFSLFNREERMHLKLVNERSAHLMMNSFSKSKRNLYRYRAETFPKNPKNRTEVAVDGKWKLTLDQSELFLLVDDGVENRIMVITTTDCLFKLPEFGKDDKHFVQLKVFLLE